MLKLLNSINDKYIKILKSLGIYDLVSLIQGKYGQVIKFIIAGATGAIIEIALFILLSEYFSIHYLLANLVAITVAILVNYIISLKWVFESGRYSQGIEFIAFLGTSSLVIMLNQFLMWGFVDGIYLDERLSKVLSIALVAIVNFFAKKFLVFKN